MNIVWGIFRLRRKMLNSPFERTRWKLNRRSGNRFRIEIAIGLSRGQRLGWDCGSSLCGGSSFLAFDIGTRCNAPTMSAWSPTNRGYRVDASGPHDASAVETRTRRDNMVTKQLLESEEPE